ncbi:MAG: hypothetical protein EPN85_00910 [Bacteroidetes bacterium]|nr:MAG: hypothetical protein EPN85_00910 [Bacteroidota bacterium]
MSLIQNIKSSAGNYFLSEEVKSLNRSKMFVNMQDAKTVGIVFNATDSDDFELVKKYITYLREMKKRVKAIGFYDQKNIPALAYSKLEYDFFCRKDLTWYNAPKSIYVKNFMDDQYDILLDLNMDDVFPLRYISSLSKASFKVGKKSDRNNSIFDLMIETTEGKGLKYFLRNIDTYLFIINKKHDKQVTVNDLD